jgi:hypothetical protein
MGFRVRLAASRAAKRRNPLRCFPKRRQVVPARLPELLKNSKAMLAMMKMKKLDIAELERAAQA